VRYLKIYFPLNLTMGFVMAFIITLIALLIERFFDWGHIRQWRWYTRYQTKLTTRIGRWPAWLALGVCILPLVLGVAIVYYLLSSWLFGLLKLFFGIFVLVYCFGPANFWAQVYACIADLHKEDPQATMAKIQKLFGLTFAHEPQAFHRAFTSALFIEANRRIFAVLFWFLFLGPAGALLYRLVDLSRANGVIAVSAAAKLHLLLDWLPVRVFTFIFALGGHFTSVLQQWKRKAWSKPSENDALVTDCGIAALDVMEAERLPEDGSAEREALALLDRVFVMSLVLLAFVVLLI
jgi:AmpE protein